MQVRVPVVQLEPHREDIKNQEEDSVVLSWVTSNSRKLDAKNRTHAAMIGKEAGIV